MERALKTFLLGSADILAMVGPLGIDWGHASPGAKAPRIALYEIDNLPDMTMDGASGLVDCRIQIDCIGLDYNSTKALQMAVRKRLLGFAGTVEAVQFQGCFLIGQRDDYSDSETPDKQHLKSMDFNIWYKET